MSRSDDFAIVILSGMGEKSRLRSTFDSIQSLYPDAPIIFFGREERVCLGLRDVDMHRVHSTHELEDRVRVLGLSYFTWTIPGDIAVRKVGFGDVLDVESAPAIVVSNTPLRVNDLVARPFTLFHLDSIREFRSLGCEREPILSSMLALLEMMSTKELLQVHSSSPFRPAPPELLYSNGYYDVLQDRAIIEGWGHAKGIPSSQIDSLVREFTLLAVDSALNEGRAMVGLSIMLHEVLNRLSMKRLRERLESVGLHHFH